MFLENSRYRNVPTVTAEVKPGVTITTLKLRTLESPAGEPYEVREHDQLDVLAYQQYGDGTKYWHIADANTELEAANLMARTGGIISKPTA